MIYVLAPAYNESENLVTLVKNINSSIKGQKQIIIIDDGSIDNSAQIIKVLSKKLPVIRVGYKKNRGAGFAFKYCFLYLIPKLKNNDLVVTMEADNTTDYKIVGKMLKEAKKGKVILASPHKKGGSFKGVSALRVALSGGAARVDSLIFGIKNVITYSSFFRVYPASSLKKIYKAYGKNFLTRNGFSAVIELLVKLDKLDEKILEVPAQVDWTKRKGKSKMNIYKNLMSHLNLYKEYFAGTLG